jgi:hypothetical protein
MALSHWFEEAADRLSMYGHDYLADVCMSMFLSKTENTDKLRRQGFAIALQTSKI